YLALVAAGVWGVAAGARMVTAFLLPLPTARISGLVIPFGLTATLVALTATPLWALYSHNPKEVPVDLRSAYSYILSRATTNDMVVGFGDIGFWSQNWFRVTDSYYLRNNRVVKGVITTG